MGKILISLTAVFVIFSSPLSAELNQNNFRLLLIEHKKDGSWEAIKYNIKTGEAWIAKNSSEWHKLIDNERLPFSSYEIKIITTSNDSWQAIRIDKRTGRSWYVIESNAWVPFTHKSPVKSQQLKSFIH